MSVAVSVLRLIVSMSTEVRSRHGGRDKPVLPLFISPACISLAGLNISPFRCVERSYGVNLS